MVQQQLLPQSTLLSVITLSVRRMGRPDIAAAATAFPFTAAAIAIAAAVAASPVGVLRDRSVQPGGVGDVAER